MLFPFMDNLKYEDHHRDHKYIQQPSSNRCQEGANLMLEKLFFHADAENSNFHCGGRKKACEHLFKKELCRPCKYYSVNLILHYHFVGL
jgi:hypothetical protein